MASAHKSTIKCQELKSEPIPCLLEKFKRGQEVDLNVEGFIYSGTFLGAHDGVVVVEDPFEVNFIVTKFVIASNVAKESKLTKDACKKRKEKKEKKLCDTVPISCSDPVPTFRRLLKSLIRTAVLLQVDGSFIQGVVQKVSKSKGIVKLLVSSAGCKSITSILLQDIEVILVPLSSSPLIMFGDPQVSLMLRN